MAFVEEEEESNLGMVTICLRNVFGSWIGMGFVVDENKKKQKSKTNRTVLVDISCRGNKI